jgi:very-short-patch-repair endonuclease
MIRLWNSGRRNGRTVSASTLWRLLRARTTLGLDVTGFIAIEQLVIDRCFFECRVRICVAVDVG